MKNFVWLALALPLVACAANQPSFFNDDGGSTPTDDAGNPIPPTDDAGNPVPPNNDAGTTPPPPPPPPSSTPLATGLPITDIAVYQAVKVTIVKNGATATKNAPIVAGRDGLVRVFVNPTSAFTHPITGVLTLTTGGQAKTFTTTLTPKTQSTDASFTSTFNFTVPGASFATNTTYLVQLKDTQGSGSGDTSAQFPTSGTATSLGVQSSGPNVQIKLFPIRFSSGGSTPATGAIDVSAYQRIVQSMYPTPNVVISVQPAITYSGSPPSAGGTGWDTLLNWLIQKRASDPAANVYYYGGFAPASSFNTYCSGGCVAGLSSIPGSPADSAYKASIGLMYGGNANDQQASGQTMAHEVGHTHGREHSPTPNNYTLGCVTPNSLDPNYPYANGGINTWGYDITAATPVNPAQYFDVMGYCQDDWISDYTYKALFSWIAADNGADMIGPQTPTLYRMVTIDESGAVVDVSDPIPMYGAVSGETHTVQLTDAQGVVRNVTGYYSPYDHLQGGLLRVPESELSSGTVRIPDFGVKAIFKLP